MSTASTRNCCAPGSTNSPCASFATASSGSSAGRRAEQADVRSDRGLSRDDVDRGSEVSKSFKQDEARRKAERDVERAAEREEERREEARERQREAERETEREREREEKMQLEARERAAEEQRATDRAVA